MRDALRGGAAAVLVAVLCVAAPPAQAAFNNGTPRGTFAGTHNYVATGGTLRAASNNANACSLNTTSTGTLSGIPSGSTILAAYLYWGGSGTNNDFTVGFNAGGTLTSTTNIAATGGNQFTELFNEDGFNFSFFGGFYDVTSIVAGKAGGPNGTYSFGGLSVTNSGNYCTNQTTLAAWALVVVYGNPSERYRYTRVYDGLQYFRGSSVTTTQSGFRVPDLVDGKVTTITWEGDPDAATSTALSGFNEALAFEGHTLLNSGCDATNNLYNSTIGTSASCSTTAYGEDIDTYDVTPYLYEGQTGATLDYSSGNDLVLLTAQVISTTNTPVADLAIVKTHNGSYFTAGQNGSYNIDVQNLGPEIAVGTATVSDTLPTGLTFVSGTGTGWTCSAVGQVVTCNNSAPSIALNAHLPALTLTVAVDGTAATSTQNTATVTHPMFDGTGGNSTSTDTVTVRHSDLSTSTKTVVDLNGGEVRPGDVLEFTVTLSETGGSGVDAAGVSVYDDLDANLENLVVVSFPAGASNNSLGSGGSDDTGILDVSGITVPAGQTRSIVFRATVVGDPGDTVDNVATVTSATGPGATPASGSLTIAPSEAPAAGQKILYVYDNQSAPNQSLSRVPQPASTAGSNYVTVNSGASKDWPLSPVLTKDLVIPAQTINVVLRTRSSTNTANVTVTLLNGSTPIGSAGPQGVSTTTSDRTWSISVPDTTITAGSTFALRVASANRALRVYARNNTNRSYFRFSTGTVISVDSVKFYSAAYSGGTETSDFEPGSTVYLRAVVSDPFGEADISSATLQLTNALGATVATSGWAQKTESPNAPELKVFEASYVVPANPSYGTYTASVTANEGTEGEITHTRSGTFNVVPKALTVAKSHSGDFTAGVNNSYTLTVSNTGASTVTGTTTVKDTLAAGLTFVSGTGSGWSCSAAVQVVTCTSSTSIAASSSMAPITLTVLVSGALGSSVDNQASVGNSTIASGFQKPGNTDTAIIRHPDVSTSTKSVSDLNGGDANPGDTLRYTITVKESAGYAASGVTVTDTLPTGLTGLTGLNTGLSTCSGSASVSGSTLTVSNVAVSGGGTCLLVFDVQVSASAGTGLLIDNYATVANPGGNGATPHATITVSQSQVAASGNKILYVYANDTMTRVAQSTTGSNTTASGVSVYHDFELSGVAANLNITAGSTITMGLWLARAGSTTTTTRNVYIKLFKRVGATDTQIGGQSNTVTFSSTTLAKQTFTITAPSFGTAGNLAAGDKLVMRIYNDSDTGGNDRSVLFQQYNAGSGSTLTISTPTVVHVDSVTIYSAAYPATTQAASYGIGETLYVRASVSDPFGSADISGGSISIKNPGGSTVATASLVNGTHTKSTSGAIRVYEYAYTVPSGAAVGSWTASVTANEGSEGTITHTGNGTFPVGGKVTLRKTWGAGATAGNAVTLTITGGTSAVGGSSTAPSTLTPATANAATGATITLAEAYTSGTAGSYTVTLSCTKDSDGTTVTPTGTGLSRTIVMPAASVTCIYNNSVTVPLTVVKLGTTFSDPINGTTFPKAIPGAIVEYQIILTNPAATAADTNTVVVTDQVPAHMDLRAADIGGAGSGPVLFTNGSPSSGLTYTFTSLSSTSDDISFSNNGGATWTYVPVPDADGIDPAVTHVRINPKGAFSGNNAQFTLKLRMRIE
ncbi:MAG: beta strand repeat-containing protein [Luteimonas sp.]